MARLEIKRKAFLARLPIKLSEHHLDVLDRWANENCSSYRIISTPKHVALFCQRDKSRTRESWQRHLRQVLKNLGIPQPKAGSRWLELIEIEEIPHQIYEANENLQHSVVGISCLRPAKVDTDSKDGDRIF